MTHAHALALAGIVAVAAVARFATLDLQSFHHDEAVTALRVIQPSLLDTLDAVVEGERSPPLYYVLAWAWSNPFGSGEVGLRSLSALFGVLTVPVAYLAARELVSSRAGLIAAALVALNPYLVWYSQEARSYALFVLLAALGFLAFVRAREQPSAGRLGLWALASGLALSSHYFAVFVVLPQAALLLLDPRQRRRTALSVGVVAAVGCALIPLAAAQEGDGRRNAFTGLPLVERAGELGLDAVAGEQPAPFGGDAATDVVQAVAAATGVALVVLAVVLVRGEPPLRRRAVAAAALVAAAAVVLPLALAVVGLDFFNPRNAVGAIPVLLVAVAGGLASTSLGRPGAVAAVGACVVFAGILAGAIVSEQMQRPNWRHAAATIEPLGSDRLLVAPRNGDQPLEYYLDASRVAVRGERERGVSGVDVLATSFRFVRRPPGFRLEDQIRMEPLFMLWRFRSDRPRTVRADELARSALGERAVVLESDG